MCIVWILHNVADVHNIVFTWVGQQDLRGLVEDFAVACQDAYTLFMHLLLWVNAQFPEFPGLFQKPILTNALQLVTGDNPNVRVRHVTIRHNLWLERFLKLNYSIESNSIET